MARSILITGASSGFGLLAARLAYARGWAVAATARKPSAIPRPEDPDEGRWLSLALDVTDPESVRWAVDAAQTRFGSLHAVVNNAGVAHMGAAEEAEAPGLRREFDVNFFGAVRVTREVLPAMRAAGRGRLVFVSSQWGRTSVPAFSGYCASKAALGAWAEALSHEVRPLGIGVTVVEPGAFDTGFGRRSLSLAAGVRDPESPYAGLYGRLREGFAGEANPTGEPVAEAILKAVSGEETRLHVPVGVEAEAWQERRFREGEDAFLRDLARSRRWTAAGEG